MTDGSDEPAGFLALATVAFLAHRQRLSLPRASKPFAIASALLALYAATFAILPPLGRALIAVSAFGALLFRGRGAAGIWGLLALSLPVMATMQFYLGYPLRLLAAEASAWTLHLLGFAVVREGSLLHWAGETIMVDAPCSGVHMLWAGGYLVCLLAAAYRLSLARTALAGSRRWAR